MERIELTEAEARELEVAASLVDSDPEQAVRIALHVTRSAREREELAPRPTS